jgi:hypothetical protein
VKCTVSSSPGRHREASKRSKYKRNDSAPTCWWCPFRILRPLVVRYLVSAPIRTHGLRQTAHRAWSGVANADAPLAHELATAPASGGHRCKCFQISERGIARQYTRQQLSALGSLGLSVLQQENSEQHEAQAREQPGIPVSTVFSYLRSPARSHAARSPIANKFETKLAAEQWLRRGVTEV